MDAEYIGTHFITLFYNLNFKINFQYAARATAKSSQADSRECLQLGSTFAHEQRPQYVDRCAVGTTFPALAWASAVAGHDGPRYTPVRRGRALAGPVWRVVARLAGRAVRALVPGVRPVSALTPSRGVAPSTGPGTKRDGLAPAHDQLDGRARASGGHRREKKDSLVGQALGRSRGHTRQDGLTTKRHLSCDAHGRI